MVRTAWEDGLGAIGGHGRSQNVCHTHWTFVSVLISMYHRQRSFSRALHYPRFSRSLRLHAALVTPLSGPTARLSETLILLGSLQKKKWLTRVAAGRTELGYIDTDPLLTLLPTVIAAHLDGDHSQLLGKLSTLQSPTDLGRVLLFMATQDKWEGLLHGRQPCPQA